MTMSANTRELYELAPVHSCPDLDHRDHGRDSDNTCNFERTCNAYDDVYSADGGTSDMGKAGDNCCILGGHGESTRTCLEHTPVRKYRSTCPKPDLFRGMAVLNSGICDDNDMTSTLSSHDGGLDECRHYDTT